MQHNQSIQPTIGFIGQGFVGKNYADDFDRRGYTTIRYSLEEPYISNKDRIAECDIVFIAVPTPTTPEGFDFSIVREAIGLVGSEKIAVIKSTVIPGTTESLQKEYSDRSVFYSPEFLSEATAAHDAAHPFASVVGIGVENPTHRRNAEKTLSVLAPTSLSLICKSVEAEFMKYTHNVNGYVQVIFYNIMYDLATTLGSKWSTIKEFLAVDPYINDWYTQPVHKSGRGAGGHCFIKDFAAFRELYAQKLPEQAVALSILDAVAQKNIELLRDSGKSLDLLTGVYGDPVLRNEA
ncbi:hypothetical protein H0X32_02685 [Patescibacteria group bacterium]|nr:hypothetical protein [Patescibacteria group bacterium]